MKTQIVLTLCMMGGAFDCAAQSSSSTRYLVDGFPYKATGTISTEPGVGEGRFEVETGLVGTVNYRIFHGDGSGSFGQIEKVESTNVHDRLDAAGWTVGCKKDEITDEKSCRAHKNDMSAMLTITVQSGGRASISVAGVQSSIFPGTAVTARVDKGSPISSVANGRGVFGPDGTAKLLQQLKSGDQVRLRYVDWPYETNVDGSFSLHGFREALDYIQWAVKRIK